MFFWSIKSKTLNRLSVKIRFFTAIIIKPRLFWAMNDELILTCKDWVVRSPYWCRDLRVCSRTTWSPRRTARTTCICRSSRSASLSIWSEVRCSSWDFRPGSNDLEEWRSSNHVWKLCFIECQVSVKFWIFNMIYWLVEKLKIIYDYLS